MRLLKFVRKIVNKLAGKRKNEFVHFPCDNPKGNVLYSYVMESVLVEDESKALDFHTNVWESREIARIFNRLGYNVDSIDWQNPDFVPRKKYDVFFDVYSNIAKIRVNKECVKILHSTTSYPEYNNKKEQERVNDLYRRKKVLLPLRRQINGKIFDKSMKKADKCTLIGNKHTFNTYPPEFRDKITCINPTASKLDYIKTVREYLPEEKEFLWFAGGGAIHKGLDLLLEIFARHPEWTLNVVGPIDIDRDFAEFYHRELTEYKNIKKHGYLCPSSKEFINICKSSFCYISPSCAEGMSTASLTALSVGLFPILSEDNGIDLPAGCGIYLKTGTIEELESSIERVMQLEDEVLTEQISAVHKYVLTKFTRENFTEQMTEFLSNILG